VRYIAGNQTPFLLAVGERDFPVLYEQAHTMAAALRQASGPVELLEIPNVDHFQISQYGGDPTHSWVQRVQAYMTDER
jgi:dipeptidyl aminopeptidase/acylaminoacyl peptidase